MPVISQIEVVLRIVGVWDFPDFAFCVHVFIYEVVDADLLFDSKYKVHWVLVLASRRLFL